MKSQGLLNSIRLALALLIVAGPGCFPFRDSPYSNTTVTSEKDLNGHTLWRLSQSNPEEDGVIRIPVFGDSHQNYSDLETVINQINGVKQADFVVNMGDFTNNSYNFEYDQFVKYWTHLSAPAFIVAGNHDLLGSGPGMYRKIFGPLNYIYETNSYRFIFFNANNLESAKDFDPKWLVDAVNESRKKVVIFSHVPLWDKERFHGDIRHTFESILGNTKVVAAINGHNHVLKITHRYGTPLIQAPRVEGAQWIVVELHPSHIQVTSSKGGQPWFLRSKPSF